MNALFNTFVIKKITHSKGLIFGFNLKKVIVVQEQDNNHMNEIVKTHKIVAGSRRTYYIDIRKSKNEEFYITISESIKRNDGRGFDKHKIFLFKEDFNRFTEKINESVEYIKKDLMPNFDFDFFTKKQDDWEAANKDKTIEDDNDDIKW